ncbi:hypothetical protein L916_08729 [Phytophthora nicotianae]|uniref:RxLR effector protein n=1 Tax=Phytophthora nicotianae TaxID=4792 RepID=W2J2H1_PHYNI|nr:hypothetical protein L916_08729 [Phytophthora nicotianae]
MRLSRVLVVIAATFLATTDALSTNTGIHAVNVISHNGPSQRLLRSDYTTAEEDDDSEARALNLEKMKTMLDAGMTAANSAKEMAKLAETHKFKKLLLYLNYVAEHT